MRDFQKFDVWQLGMDIAYRVFELFGSIPLQQMGFKIRDQATDAACSVPSNIAEGSAHRSEKQKYHYLEIALGSSFELQTRLLIVQNRKWAHAGTMEKLLADLDLEQKKLVAFMAKFDQG